MAEKYVGLRDAAGFVGFCGWLLLALSAVGGTVIALNVGAIAGTASGLGGAAAALVLVGIGKIGVATGWTAEHAAQLVNLQAAAATPKERSYAPGTSGRVEQYRGEQIRVSGDGEVHALGQRYKSITEAQRAIDSSAR